MEDRNSVYIFGRDVSMIPCFRNSFLYGIYGGLGGGLLHFLFTSKVTRSSHVAMGSFCGVTLSYWFYCRYHFSKQQLELNKISEYLQHRVLVEGTALEKIHEGDIADIKMEK